MLACYRKAVILSAYAHWDLCIDNEQNQQPQSGPARSDRTFVHDCIEPGSHQERVAQSVCCHLAKPQQYLFKVAAAAEIVHLIQYLV